VKGETWIRGLTARSVKEGGKGHHRVNRILGKKGWRGRWRFGGLEKTNSGIRSSLGGEIDEGGRNCKKTVKRTQKMMSVVGCSVGEGRELNRTDSDTNKGGRDGRKIA